MNYHSDDGSTFGGIAVAIAIVLAFTAGYWVRDQGVSVKVSVPQVRQK